jgi:hypothetical protein
MSAESVFQNIENVLLRIEEIKRRFGIKHTSHYFDKTLSFDQELKNLSDYETAEELSAKNGPESLERDDRIIYEELIEAASEKYRIPEPLRYWVLRTLTMRRKIYLAGPVICGN